MKTLLLIRHAKAEPQGFSQKDFDRSLNERGRKDAVTMSKRLIKKNIKLDAFISSSAERAKETAVLFAKEFGKKKKEVVLIDELYLATSEIFYKAISSTNDSFDHIALVSHNPGIAEFANTLTNVRIDDMPTCSVFVVKIHCKTWKEFAEAKKEFLLFDFPKNTVL